VSWANLEHGGGETGSAHDHEGLYHLPSRYERVDPM